MAQSPSSTAEEPGKNIVLCFDGTGDWATRDRTNVFEIFCQVQEEPTLGTEERPQLAYYDGGVGTLTNPAALSAWNRAWLRILDLATATSLRTKVLDAYEFLVDNYKSNDRIYLFGFSRGAFMARILAAMIHRFGLLRPQHKHLSAYLWQSISELKLFKQFAIDGDLISSSFGRHDEEPVTIEFIGLFDTVSSVGVFERFRVFPNTDKNPSVLHARHAVSIHERRNAFPDELLNPTQGDVVEVWFPGVHRDIGGGNKDRPGQSKTTLEWVMREARSAGLHFKKDPDPCWSQTPIQVNHADFDWYVFAGLYPMTMFDRVFGNFRLRWPTFKKTRIIPDNALVYPGPALEAPAPLPTNVPKSVVFTDLVSTPYQPRTYFYKRPHVTWSAFFSILLGVGASVLFANSAFENLLGVFPIGVGWVAASLVVFLWVEGREEVLKQPERALFFAIPVALLVLAFANPATWIGLLWAALLGALVALVSLCPPWPAVAADRVIPLFAWPAIAIGGAKFLSKAVSVALLGQTEVANPFRLSFTLNHVLHTFYLIPLVLLALLLAFWLYGLAAIVQDRLRLGEVSIRNVGDDRWAVFIGGKQSQVSVTVEPGARDPLVSVLRTMSGRRSIRSVSVLVFPQDSNKSPTELLFSSDKFNLPYQK